MAPQRNFLTHDPHQKMADAMWAVAGSLKDREPDDKWIAFLRKNAEAARILGQLSREADEEFSAAFPGETREESFTNAEWTANGFDYVAVENDLMGLKKS